MVIRSDSEGSYKEGMRMLGFNQMIRVTCIMCKKTFPVNEGMVNPEEKGLQLCVCPFCKGVTEVKVISVVKN